MGTLETSRRQLFIQNSAVLAERAFLTANPDALADQFRGYVSPSSAPP
jgi:hypothetical protein